MKRNYFLREKRRGSPRKVDAGPNKDAMTKYFKSAKGKKGARGCAKPKKILSPQFLG